MITEEMIENGAAELREHQMQGRITRQWDSIPKGQRRKWLEAAERVLRAAHNEPE